VQYKKFIRRITRFSDGKSDVSECFASDRPP